MQSKRRPRPVLISLADQKIAKEGDRYCFNNNILSRAKVRSPTKCAYHPKHSLNVEYDTDYKRIRARTTAPSPMNIITPSVPTKRNPITYQTEYKSRPLEKSMLLEETGGETKRMMVTEFKRMDKNEFKKLIDYSSVGPISPNDCSAILDNSMISQNSKNKSFFMVCSNDELLQEELAQSKKELHKERQRNAELWSVYRKTNGLLNERQKEYEQAKGKWKKEESAKTSAKAYIEKQATEIKEHERISTSLREEAIGISRSRAKVEDLLKKVTQINSIYQTIIRKMLENPQTKKTTVDSMKALRLIPNGMNKYSNVK